MSEAEKRLKANRVLEGRPCGWCGEPLVFGDDTAVCQACGKPHHAACWDDKRGCSDEECVNAPLKEMEGAPVVDVPPDKMPCPHCGAHLRIGTEVCVFCRRITSPDGVYHGPKKNAPDAVASMVWGIVSIFFCGLILGIVAIAKSRNARNSIEEDPMLGGGGYATAGMVLGIIGVVLWGIWILIQFASWGQ